MPIVYVAGAADPALLQAVAEILRKAAMVSGVQIMPREQRQLPTSDPNVGQVFCTVSVTGEASGLVQINLKMPGRNDIDRAAQFVNKPWAANFAQYVAGVNKPIVRAVSPAVATFEQAQQEALREAARQLEPYVRSAISSGPMEEPGYVVVGKPVISVPGGRVESQVLREVVMSELRAGRLILDRFPQQFDRPYGRLWREQLLIDASQNAMERVAFKAVTRQHMLAGAEARQRTAERQTWATLTVSLGGLAVLIFAVYLVLNAATKGYYTWVLRLLAVGAIIAGLALACIA